VPYLSPSSTPLLEIKPFTTKLSPENRFEKALGNVLSHLIVHIINKKKTASNVNLTLRIFPTFASCIRTAKTKSRALFIIKSISTACMCSKS